MKRKPSLFRSWGDALLCLALLAVIIGCLVLGLMIVAASLKGKLMDPSYLSDSEIQAFEEQTCCVCKGSWAIAPGGLCGRCAERELNERLRAPGTADSEA